MIHKQTLAVYEQVFKREVENYEKENPSSFTDADAILPTNSADENLLDATAIQR